MSSLVRLMDVDGNAVGIELAVGAGDTLEMRFVQPVAATSVVPRFATTRTELRTSLWNQLGTEWVDPFGVKLRWAPEQDHVYVQVTSLPSPPHVREFRLSLDGLTQLVAPTVEKS